jgi:hypothetical protein
MSFTFIPDRIVFANTLDVFPFGDESAFAILQGRTHEVWVRSLPSSMKDDLRYTPSDVFETFPFPSSWNHDAELHRVGCEYYEFRAALMVGNNEGLTSTYNRFHDRYETDPRVIQLRALHDAMDRAVLDAYGWTDIRPTCEFLLDYEIDEEDWGNKRKPYRYRWPDEVRDEVLGRLLALNAERAKQEQLAGAATTSPAKRSKKRESAKKGGGLLEGV